MYLMNNINYLLIRDKRGFCDIFKIYSQGFMRIQFLTAKDNRPSFSIMFLYFALGILSFLD